MEKICATCNISKRLFNFPRYKCGIEKVLRYMKVCHRCRYGTPQKNSTSPTSCIDYQVYVKSILEKHLIKKDGCWEWKGSTNRQGYGEIRPNRRHMNASRASWIAYRGKIPKGMYVLHTCDNPPCCNPDHLWLGTPSDNMKDMIKKGRNKNLKGSDCPWATINEEIVLDILDMLKKNINTREIAQKYNIKLSMISDIKTGHRWPHIGDRTGIEVIPYKRKLTKSDVIYIKKRISQGDKLKSIADEYGCSHTTIGDIKHNRSWKHVTID